MLYRRELEEKDIMNKQTKNDQIILKLIFQELKENPYKKFNLAFSLMVIIPFLVFFYLLASKLFSISILAGNVGLVLFLTFFISVCGFLLAYNILRNILNKVIFYAVAAKHSDQIKSSFVATVSHELKNPLSSIKMNLYNIFSGLIGVINNEQKQVIEFCQGTIERMLRLVNDLLDLHKIEAGAVDVNRKLCNLVEISEKQIKELEPLINNKHIQLKREFVNKDLSVWGDEDKLSRVVNNLLSNSIKFTPEGQIVAIRLYTEEGFIKIECKDTGPGIAVDQINKLFNKFERLGATKEGTGLGLTITKDIVEMHKGKISVESQLGKGSKFTVTLPGDLRKITR